jgi:hypothetical protein
VISLRHGRVIELAAAALPTAGATSCLTKNAGSLPRGMAPAPNGSMILPAAHPALVVECVPAGVASPFLPASNVRLQSVIGDAETVCTPTYSANVGATCRAAARRGRARLAARRCRSARRSATQLHVARTP